MPFITIAAVSVVGSGGLTVYGGAPSGEPLLKPLSSIRVPAGQKKKKNYTNTAAISENASATTLFTR